LAERRVPVGQDLSRRPDTGYPGRVQRLFLAVAVTFALAQAWPARAADQRAADQPLVILTEAGRKDAEDAAFFSSVRALAAEIGIGLSTQEVVTFEAVRDALLAQARQETKPFLVAWILRGEKTREVHLFDPWKNQLRTRTLAAGASATANAETLALILRAELLAYLNEPPPPPPPAPPPPPPPPPRSDPRWAFGIAYVAGTFLRGEDPQQGVGLGLEHRWTHLRLSAHYAILPGQDVDTDDVALTVHRHPFDLALGYAWPEQGRWCLVPEAFLSGDLLSRHTSSAPNPLLPQPDSGRFLIGGGVRGRVELRVLRNLSLHVSLGTEVPLNPHDFQVRRGTTATTVARLAPVRVSGEVGVNLLAF
jgi:hypothetical protein